MNNWDDLIEFNDGPNVSFNLTKSYLYCKFSRSLTVNFVKHFKYVNLGYSKNNNAIVFEFCNDSELGIKIIKTFPKPDYETQRIYLTRFAKAFKIDFSKYLKKKFYLKEINLPNKENCFAVYL
jgi:hypothetical protein